MQTDNTKTVFDPGGPTLESLGIDIPAYIDQDLDLAQVRAIVQLGCDSGAYMPAVTYWQAEQTMLHHGEAVLDEIDGLGPFSFDPSSDSWLGFACKLVSLAVESWAAHVLEEAESALEDKVDGFCESARALGAKLGGDLSGEWADSMTPQGLLAHLGLMDTCPDTTSALCDAFEEGAAEREGDE